MTQQSPLATVPRRSDVETLRLAQQGVSHDQTTSAPDLVTLFNGTVPPRRVPNAELRTREYLDEAEVERLMRAAKANRNGQRNATMILIAFRHGLRAAELVDLRWDQVDLGRNACLHVRRGTICPLCRARTKHSPRWPSCSLQKRGHTSH